MATGGEFATSCSVKCLPVLKGMVIARKYPALTAVKRA
jgi:hypothetical protein